MLAFNDDDSVRLLAASGSTSLASRETQTLTCATSACAVRIDVHSSMLAWIEPTAIATDKCLYHFRSGSSGYHELVAIESLWCQPAWCGKD